jgi:hypothetical protein
MSNNIFFSRNSCRLWENVQKYGTLATDGNIRRRMRIECWINKARDTNSEYVTYFAFRRQKLSRERASMFSLKPIYRVIKKSLCTWWLQYRKLQVMFKVSLASLQTFIGTPNCVLEDRVQYSTVHIPNVFCDGHLRIISCVGKVRIHWVRCTETFWSPCIIYNNRNAKTSCLQNYFIFFSPLCRSIIARFSPTLFAGKKKTNRPTCSVFVFVAVSRISTVIIFDRFRAVT